MSYRINFEQPIFDNIRRIADEQLASANKTINDCELRKANKVHQIRKHCKKIRGLIRLVRPVLGKTYDEENSWYRDTAQSVSGLRDARAMIATYDATVEYFEDQINRSAFGSIRRRLTWMRKQKAAKGIELDKVLQKIRKRLKQGRARVGDWSFDEAGFEAIEGGFLKTYKQGFKLAQQASEAGAGDEENETFHEWRKSVKYHWYHCRLLQSIWPTVMRARRAETHRLSKLLGDARDLAVLGCHIKETPEEVGIGKNVAAFLSLVTRRRKQLESQSLELGKKLYADEPNAIVARISIWGINATN